MRHISREDAAALLKKYNKDPFHIRHAFTMEAVMQWYAKELGYENDAEYWGIVGLLHDIDFELYPEEHCLKAPELLKEGGVGDDIIHAVEDINKRYGKNKFTLDIYGQIDEKYQDIFEIVIKQFPEYIRYCGSVSFDKSTDVLKNYFALVFPTRFYTEGIPGTIIDAYASGVPVVSSKWESFYDMIDDGKVGYGYQFGNYDDLVNVLIYIAENPECMIKMKTNCIEKAHEYAADKVVGKFVRGVVQARH